MNYNMAVFSIKGRSYFIICFIMASENNFSYFIGVKIRNTCLNYLACFILSIIRTFLLTYFVYVIIPDLIFLYINTWLLNSNN